MLSLPALLSFSLPSISLPAVSLPVNIQRRFLSFLLKRTLGHLVKPGQLDTGQIEAQIGDGWVEIKDIELDQDAINGLLADLPVQLHDGCISKITAQIPWPNIFTAPFSLSLSSLQLSFTLRPVPSTVPPPSNVDLTASVTSVAETFVHDELSRRETSALHESLSSGAAGKSTDEEERFPPGSMNPFLDEDIQTASESSADAGELEGVSIFTTLLERLLARFSFRVTDTQIRLTHPAMAEYILNIPEITYAMEGGDEGTPMTRTIKVVGLEMSFRSLAPPHASSSHLNTPVTEGFPSAPTSSSEEEEPMSMSQSIVSLPQSSMYHSTASTAHHSPQHSPSAIPNSPINSHNQLSDSPVVIFSLSSEPIVIRMGNMNLSTVPTPSKVIEPTHETLRQSGHPTDEKLDDKRTPNISVHVNLGALAIGLTENHIQTLVSSATFAMPPADPRGSCSEMKPVDEPVTSSGTIWAVDVRVRVKGVVLLLLQSPEVSSELADFFLRPLSPPLRRQHLRIHLDAIEATLLGQTARFTLGDMSVFAISRPATSLDAGGWVAKPILVVDPHLPYQYDPNAASFPIFEVSDWRKAGALNVRPSLWRARIPANSKRKPPAPSGHVIPAGQLDMTMGPGGLSSVRLTLQPIHIFADLAVIGDIFTSITLRENSPNYPGGVSEAGRTVHAAANTKKKRGSKEDEADRPDTKPATFGIHFSVLRLQIRAPPSPLWEPVGTDSSVRSGSFVLDVHDLQLGSGSSLQAHTPARFAMSETPQTAVTGKVLLGQVEWRRIFLSFAGPHEPRASSFGSLGPLVLPDAGQTAVEQPVLPLVHIRSAAFSQPGNGQSMSLEICIPSAQIMLDKATLDGLQVFGDDCSQWADALFGEGRIQSGATTRTPSMIGSRYFVKPPRSLASSKADSLRDFTSGDNVVPSTELVVSLAIAESALRLLLTRGSPDGPQNIHPLTVWTSDLEVLAEIKPEGKNENVISVTIADAKVAISSAAGANTTLLEVTPPFRQAVKSRPMLEIRVKSIIDPDTTARQSSINLTAARFTYTLTSDLSWIEDIVVFLKAPPGVFEAVVPSERTRLSLRVYDGSLQILAPRHAGGLVVTMNDMAVSTELISDLPEIMIQLQLRSLHIVFVDDIFTLTQPHSLNVKRGVASAVDIWQAQGYVLVADLADLEMAVTNQTHPSSNDVRVDRVKLAMHLCADTMAAIGDFGKDFGSAFASTQKSQEPKAKVDSIPFTQRPKRDSLLSLEENAFTLPDVGYTGDMIDDNLPTNPYYLDSAYGASGGVAVLPEEDFEELSDGERSPGPETPTPGTPESVGILSNIKGETIRILDSDGLNIVEDYLDTVTPVDDDISGTVNDDILARVRIRECDVKVHLHDGYDWQATRKAIDEEIRAMRRKLLKIRQLLASGQAPDHSVEETHAWLFNSVHIGLTEVDEDMEPAAIIAAIDKELDDELETASQSSWQTLNPPPSDIKTAVSPKSAADHSSRGRKKRLTRSKHSRIDVCLYGLQAEVDNFRPHDRDLVSRVLVDIKDLEILDHIKTSTWKKFLSEMKSDSKGNIRETGSNMARVELRMVRPSRTLDNEEARLKIKVLPIRLHVDQDALDFLKAFGSFSNPQTPAPSQLPTAPPAQEIFFQHVEVFPVALKLDYKPKRVDYKALKEGKTIELMNFFHFDGAEMTLRHITLSGITGWATLGDTLNDLWTPDVKANQMVDIISGIAPIRSIVNVGSGFADLILLPISQYKKDGRIIRGVQKGAKSFFKSSAMEAVTVVGRIATGTQVILEAAEDALGGNQERRAGSVLAEPIENEYFGSPRLQTRQGLPLPDNESEEGDLSQSFLVGFSGDNAISRYADQPPGLKEGVQAAYKSLGKNLNEAAQTILAVPMEVYERSGNEGPVKKVIRAVPIAVLKPMIGASEAVSKTLLGLRNSMDPGNRRENEEKYKQ
ncbi:autophagy- protein 2 [Tulasnella sp. JGI-2019a]|nr:autophagy- protein 2 [Tulasnella sp. JGI-2019a]KAG9015728.1 autophagy- protein 2 [Tulasnella sp. JGI-2019a]